MALFPSYSIRESCLLGFENKGFIPATKVLGWRLEIKGEVSCPRDDEVDVLASFYEHGFGLLPSSLRVGDPPLLPPKDLEPPR